MNSQTREPSWKEIEFLAERGFRYLGKTASVGEFTSDWFFSKNFQLYDLSAADISEIDEIEAKKLFIVKA